MASAASASVASSSSATAPGVISFGHRRIDGAPGSRDPLEDIGVVNIADRRAALRPPSPSSRRARCACMAEHLADRRVAARHETGPRLTAVRSGASMAAPSIAALGGFCAHGALRALDQHREMIGAEGVKAPAALEQRGKIRRRELPAEAVLLGAVGVDRSAASDQRADRKAFARPSTPGASPRRTAALLDDEQPV